MNLLSSTNPKKPGINPWNKKPKPGKFKKEIITWNFGKVFSFGKKV